MSPKNNIHEPSVGPDVTVDISHGVEQSSPAPSTAPPLSEIEPLPIRPINIVDNAPTPLPASMAVPPILPDEFHQHETRRWPAILMYTTLAFLVAALVVFTGRWIYRKTTHQTPKTITSEGVKLPAVPPTSSQPSTSIAPTTSVTGGQLPNNGPGNVIAIFVGTTLAATGLHFIYNLRKQN